MRLALATVGTFTGILSNRSARTAISADAERLSGYAATIFRSFLGSATGQRQWAEPIAKLIELRDRCSEDDWDGDGASPISPLAFDEAVTLLTALPSTFPPPEPLPEPNGSIAFEWYRGRDRVYVLSLSGTKSIEFAGLFGAGNELHGRVNFESALPKRIQQDLASFLAQP